MCFLNFFKKKSKENALKWALQMMMRKPPSEHFATGPVFDIICQNHDRFVGIVNSADVTSLKKFFVDAYFDFCDLSLIAMTGVGRTDTNPLTWNADIVNLPSGEKAALCFMPVNNEVFMARVVGVVLGDGGDRYYYCMVKKDSNEYSDVIQNNAMLGIEKIGSVKGVGIELMNSFVDCIKNHN